MEEGLWCILPMTIWVFSTSLTVCVSVCVCVCEWYTPLIPAAVGGEKSEYCQPQNSQIRALSGRVDITIQNRPTFSHLPAVHLDTTQPASSSLLCCSLSRLQVHKLDSSLFFFLGFCEINSNFPSAAARWFSGIIQMEGKWGKERNSCCEA